VGVGLAGCCACWAGHEARVGWLCL
jgi:hypothetical protein